MLSTKYICFLVVSVAYVAAAEKGKCAKEHNVDKSDLDELRKNPIEPAEKLLCFTKCEYEGAGVLNADKTVNADKLIERMEKWKVLQITTKKEIKECVQKLTVPVSSCSDVKPYYLCVHHAVKKEDANKSKCGEELNVDESDWHELKKNPTTPTEKMLCLFKCEYEGSEALNADKTVNVDKLIAHIEKWMILQETNKNKIKECVQKLTIPVNSCSDVKPYHLCVYHGVKKETA